jgi:pyruvate-formate lyase-activating enzyme
MSGAERHADLMRQGFMKPTRQRKPKAEQPVVACDRCQNWHRKGQHTAPKMPAPSTSKERVRIIEGVAYRPFVVRCRLKSGRRLRRIYWSPGEPWVGTEVSRALGAEFGYENLINIKIERAP